MSLTSTLPSRISDDVFTNSEALALAGFLAGYSGLTRSAYALDLRQYASFCGSHRLPLFEARRAHIETFARSSRPAAHAQRSRGASAPLPASTDTQNRQV